MDPLNVNQKSILYLFDCITYHQIKSTMISFSVKSFLFDKPLPEDGYY
jgi:hypothetical protein